MSYNVAFCLGVQEIWPSGEYQAFLRSSSKMKKQEVTQEVNNVQNGTDTNAGIYTHIFVGITQCQLIKDMAPTKKTSPPCCKCPSTSDDVYIHFDCWGTHTSGVQVMDIALSTLSF